MNGDTPSLQSLLPTVVLFLTTLAAAGAGIVWLARNRMPRFGVPQTGPKAEIMTRQRTWGLSLTIIRIGSQWLLITQSSGQLQVTPIQPGPPEKP